MATVSVSIKDTKKTEVEDAVAALNGYQSTVMDANGAPIANPETKATFMNKMVKAWLQNQLIEYKNRQAAATVAGQDNTL